MADSVAMINAFAALMRFRIASRYGRRRNTTIRKIISLPIKLWKQVEDYQFEARVKWDTEAVRRLIELGLQVHHGKKKNAKENE
jgi:hypothetical protein